MTHGPIPETQMLFVTVGITLGTPVPETAMEFVHGVGVLTVPIHEAAHGRDAILTGIAHMLDVLALTGMRMVWVSAGHQVVIFQVFGGGWLQGLLALLVIAPG